MKQAHWLAEVYLRTWTLAQTALGRRAAQGHCFWVEDLRRGVFNVSAAGNYGASRFVHFIVGGEKSQTDFPRRNQWYCNLWAINVDWRISYAPDCIHSQGRLLNDAQAEIDSLLDSAGNLFFKKLYCARRIVRFKISHRQPHSTITVFTLHLLPTIWRRSLPLCPFWCHWSSRRGLFFAVSMVGKTFSTAVPRARKGLSRRTGATSGSNRQETHAQIRHRVTT